MTKLGLVLALAAIVTMPTMKAYAEGDIPDIEGVIYEEPIEKTRRTTLGLGVASVPDYEGSEDAEVLPAPMVRVDWQSRRYVEFSGVQFRANLVSGAGKWRAGPTLKYNIGRKDVDNDRVDALRDIDATIEGGAFVTFDAGRMETYLEVLTDVGDEHEGSLVTIRQTYKHPLENRQLLTVSLSLTYADDDYMETFFSIDANNAIRSGLRTFEADAGVKDVELSMVFLDNISERWNIAYALGFKRLLGDAADSPVVDDEGSDGQFFAAIIGSLTF